MSYMSLFDKDDQERACKVLDYYDGDSKEHLLKFLQLYRKNALKKGMIPRTRNIVKMVADKSGMLFNGKAPTINVYNGEVIDEAASIITLQALESADWVEFFTNFDVVLRLLKTAYVLVQVNPETKQFIFEMLDQHNAAVQLDAFKNLEVLIYCIGKCDDKMAYRVWTLEEVFDITVDEHGNESVIPGTTLPNTLGLIPASVFHDTNTPRTDSWNEVPEDLIEINDIYNLHISDSEFSAMWAKQPTLFTNAVIQGGAGQQMVTEQHLGESLPRWVPSSDPGFVGGPGTVVALETSGEAVYLDYKGPVPPLKELDAIIKAWVADFAGDWSVSVAAEGNGQADSGFKLVVKELPNLQLKAQRSRMFEAGFKRFYRVLKAVLGSIGVGLPENSELFVKFGKPDLPIDEKSTEEVWSRKIQEKRASRVDYFMEVHGMSKEEALNKIAEIDAEAPIQPNRAVPTSVLQTSVTI